MTAVGSQTEVVIDIALGAAGVAQPVHIHDGTCANLGAVKYPLTNLVDGKSATMVNVPLKDLRTGKFAINAHKSQAEISLYVSCGNILAAPAAAPTTGVGSTDDGGNGLAVWAYALMAASAVIAVGGLGVLRGVRNRR